jgi:2-keto-4-pentenoate hydratase
MTVLAALDGWDITLADTIADNGSSARFVLGAGRVELGDLDLAGS